MITRTTTNKIAGASGITRSGLNKFILVFCSGFALLMGCYWIWATILRLETPEIYSEDFTQEYVLARTFLDGTDPYQSLQSLYTQYVPGAVYPLLHGKWRTNELNFIDSIRPTPHPPTVGVMVFLIGFLDYTTAVVLWWIIELLLLWFAVYLNLVIHNYFSENPEHSKHRLPFLSNRALATWLITIALFAWQPTVLDIALGQIEIPILFLVTLSLYFISKSENILCYYPFPYCMKHNYKLYAGIAFGLSLAVKPLALFLIITFLLRKQFTTIWAASATLYVVALIALFRYGIQPITEYVTEVIPMFSTLYRGYIANFSFLSIPYLLTQNTTIAQFSTYFLVFLALIFVLLFHRKQRPWAEQFGAACIASVFISPIVWIHYFSLFLVAIFAIPFRQLNISHYAKIGWLTIPYFMGYSDIVNHSIGAPILYVLFVSIPFIVYYFTTMTPPFRSTSNPNIPSLAA